MVFSELVVWGMVAHCVADWFLQTDWQAANKTRIGHPAGLVHMACHGTCLLFVFPVTIACVLAVVHYAIDLRKPLEWWRWLAGQAKPNNPMAVHVKIWQDQASHFLCIAVAAWITATYC